MIAKKYRINREKIPYILKKGLNYKTQLFIIREMENSKDFPRFSVIISKKISTKAVIRNKMKRQIMEAIRLRLKEFTPKKNSDIIIIPKKNITEAKYSDITLDITNIIK